MFFTNLRKFELKLVLCITLALSAPTNLHAQSLDQAIGKLLEQALRPAPKQARQSPAVVAAPRYNAIVADAQSRLNELGYDAGPVDGEFGQRTLQAMNAFQRDRGLRMTTMVDRSTLDALRREAMTTFDGFQRPQQAGANEAASPGFECKRASTATEQTICRSRPLRQADAQVSQLYSTLLSQSSGAEAEIQLRYQRSFIIERDTCHADESCLLQAYMRRMAVLIPMANGNLEHEPSDSVAAQPSRVSSATAIPISGRSLDALRAPPEGIRAWSLPERDRLPIFDNPREISAFIELFQLKNEPDHFERNECAFFQLFFTETVRERFSARGGCGPKVNWKGDDEFSRAETREQFYQQYVPQLMSVLPDLPQTIILIDDVKLGEFDTNSTSFPLQGRTSLLETLFEVNRGYGLRYADTNGRDQNGRFPKISPITPLPAMSLPMKSTKAARELITAVNSWTYINALGTAQKGQRTVRRQAVVEFVSFDQEARRFDVRLQSLGIFDLDLNHEIYAFPLKSTPLSVVSGAVSNKIKVPSPTRLDNAYLALRYIEALTDNAPQEMWDTLRGAIATRDNEFYQAQKERPNALPDYDENDVRRPFFAQGDYDMPVSRWALFKEWARTYAAALPELVEYERDYTNIGLTASKTYSFSALPGNAVNRQFYQALETAGIQPEQVVQNSSGSGRATLIVLPNNLDFFSVELPGEVVAPYAGVKIMLKTLFRAQGPAEQLETTQGSVLLLRMEPVSFHAEVDGQEIASHGFGDVPNLNGGFSQPQSPATAVNDLFGEPRQISNEITNLLLASALDPADPLYGGLVVQRWQVEQADDISSDKFFIAGKREPSMKEAGRLATEFSAWAKARVPSLPTEIVVTAAFDQPEKAGEQAIAWSSLACLSRGLRQDDLNRIAANARRHRTDQAREEMAKAGNASWTPEDDKRQMALASEARVAHLVSLLECGSRNDPSHNPVPVYMVSQSAFPVAPQEAMAADVRLRIVGIERVSQQPFYLDLLPAKLQSYLVSGYRPAAGNFVRINVELIDIAFRNETGAEISRIKHDPMLSLQNFISQFENIDGKLSVSTSETPYGYDILDIKVGMSFDEAEKIIRNHMNVGRTLVGMRASDGSMEQGIVQPATSGKLFISDDGTEYIALLDEAPAVEGKILAAWRRIYLEPNQMPIIEVIENLRSKYGDLKLPSIEEGVRNYWSSPVGYDCRSGYQQGGERPALSSRWRENGQPVVIMLPDGRPVPDAMLPQALMDPLSPSWNNYHDCGPTFTAEFIFSASKTVSAGYPTKERDWVEQIITDIHPYIEAFQTNRTSIQASEADGSGENPAKRPAIKF